MQSQHPSLAKILKVRGSLVHSSAFLLEFLRIFSLTRESEEDHLNPLPNDKILEMTKLKAFADDKLNVAKMTISLFGRVENPMGKGENAGHQHFFPFPTGFSKALFLRLVKSRDYMAKVLKAIFHYRPKIWSGHGHGRTGRTAFDGLARSPW